MKNNIIIKPLISKTLTRDEVKELSKKYSRIFKEKCDSIKNDHAYRFSVDGDTIQGSFDCEPGAEPKNIVFLWKNKKGESQTTIFPQLTDVQPYKNFLKFVTKIQEVFSKQKKPQSQLEIF